MSNKQRFKKINFHYLLCLVIALLAFSPTWATSKSSEPNTNPIQIITHGMSLAKSCEQALMLLDKRYPATTLNNDVFICMAYLNGMMAALQHANDQSKLQFALDTRGQGDQAAFNLYCFDWQLSFQKIAKIVLTFAQQNPMYLNQPAHDLALRALQTAFPCR